MPPVIWKKAEDLLKFEGLYVFGGLLKDGTINEKLYILALMNDPENKNKMKLVWKNEDELHIKGRAPTGRFDHAMQKLNNTLVVFGGKKMNKDKAFAESIYVLQLSSLTWTRLQQASGLPNQFHVGFSEFSHILIGDDCCAGKFDQAHNSKILIFGGIDKDF